MNELVSHIEFLLHSHDCVIVPDLGGFVINTCPVKKNGPATFEAPTCELIFNRDLTYNDGLLVESFMKTNGISFETAYNRVEAGVDELKSALRENKTVEFGKLGTFQINEEGHYVFTPNPTFVKPEFYGLTNVSLNPIPHVAKTQKKYRTTIRNIGIGAAVAITAAAILFLSPLNKNDYLRQNAKMIWESGLFRNNATKHTPRKTANPAKVTTSANVVGEQNNKKAVSQTDTAINAPSQKSKDATTQPIMKKYYVVMGVYETRKVAEKMKNMLESEGFTQTSWIERPGRIDVYVASFADQDSAKNFLKKVHSQYPHHRDAWILKY